jgi:sugar phosphate isomerase/epimerase
MYLTGFADEAAKGIDGQIRATKALGWSRIESRNIDGVNLHDLPDDKFEEVYAKLAEAGVTVNCFGSAIANWSKSIEKPYDDDIASARRAVARMKRLGTKFIRIMSYPPLADRPMDDQMAEERFRRLREICALFLDEGLQPLHENCMNYGGQGWRYTLQMLEAVPGLKLVFDTGNPVNTIDRDDPSRHQSSWDFFDHVRDHVIYVHIKDGVIDENGKTKWVWCGEGEGDVKRIVADLVARGYDGGFSMEPHMAVVAHDSSVTSEDEIRFSNYVEYGRRFERILEECGAKAC